MRLSDVGFLDIQFSKEGAAYFQLDIEDLGPGKVTEGTGLRVDMPGAGGGKFVRMMKVLGVSRVEFRGTRRVHVEILREFFEQDEDPTKRRRLSDALLKKIGTVTIG
ncbi:MAG: hypothetical protein COA47_10335 [Robiginitomaculum sp.]|nr:MAG: hypothetical protein COA47_10335 [Robiginitomaculum sp.]